MKRAIYGSYVTACMNTMQAFKWRGFATNVPSFIIICIVCTIITHADANSAIISIITVVAKSVCVASYHLQILDHYTYKNGYKHSHRASLLQFVPTLTFNRACCCIKACLSLCFAILNCKSYQAWLIWSTNMFIYELYWLVVNCLPLFTGSRGLPVLRLSLQVSSSQVNQYGSPNCISNNYCLCLLCKYTHPHTHASIIPRLFQFFSVACYKHGSAWNLILIMWLACI